MSSVLLRRPGPSGCPSQPSVETGWATSRSWGRRQVSARSGQERWGVRERGPTRGNKGERSASCGPRWRIIMARKSNPPREIDPLNTALLAAVRSKPPGNLPPARVLYAIRKLIADGYSDEEVSAGLASARLTIAATELAHALKSVRDNRSARAAERVRTGGPGRCGIGRERARFAAGQRAISNEAGQHAAAARCRTGLPRRRVARHRRAGQDGDTATIHDRTRRHA